MVSHWSLSDSWSPQVSWTLLSILVDTVVWVISIHPLISTSSSPSTNRLLTVPSAPITIGITVIFTFHVFFSSLAKSMCRRLAMIGWSVCISFLLLLLLLLLLLFSLDNGNKVFVSFKYIIPLLIRFLHKKFVFWKVEILRVLLFS